MPVYTFWCSERINHPASVHAWYRGPTGFNGSVCRRMVFPLFFPLAREVFWVFTFIFSYMFSSFERGFLRLKFFMFRDSFVYFSCFISTRSGFFERVGLC